jgi:hypothetical protein
MTCFSAQKTTRIKAKWWGCQLADGQNIARSVASIYRQLPCAPFHLYQFYEWVGSGLKTMDSGT